jgi:hypothetical protein
MLTQSYAQPTVDPAMLWANLAEWLLREEAYRAAHPDEVPVEATLAEMVPARDAGDVCHVCGNLVTWVNHLPPTKAGGPVRCFTNVAALPVGNGVRIIDGKPFFSASWR